MHVAAARKSCCRCCAGLYFGGQAARAPGGDFAEHGAWENEWFNPIGAFDWQAIDRFDIVAEHHALDGIQFWFDELRIVGPVLTAVRHEAASQPTALALAANYPNPFNATTACGPRFAFAKRRGALLKGCPSASTLPQ